MKLQLLILSALLLSAFACPIPDEEVSPVKAIAAPEIKSDAAPAASDKLAEDIKSDTRAAAPVAELKAEEKKPEKLELPQGAPDAEIAQPLPEKKEDLKLTEKQTRAEDNKLNEPKALPVVEGPVAGLESDKQIVDEIQPAVQEAQPAGKSADIIAAAPAEAPAAEQKKEELSAAESAPALKTEKLPAEVAQELSEEKKAEDKPRQERGTEEKAQEAVSVEEVKPVEPAPVVPVNPEVVPEVKRAKSEIAEEKEPAKLAEPIKEAENAKLLKAEEKPAEPLAAAGDIAKPQIIEDDDAKVLPAEAKPAEAAPIETKKIDEQPLAKAAEEPALESGKLKSLAPAPTPDDALTAEPIKKLEEKPTLAEENKSEDSKESKESESESKESGESKEEKSN